MAPTYAQDTGDSVPPPDPIDFEFFRPRYHVIASKNWLNDPCAPFYNGTHYHLFYQWNPSGVSWGNISWAHVVSTDMIHWQDESLSMTTDQIYDQKGVFSGSSLANGMHGLPTIMYTAVNALPISWKMAHTKGAEKQAIAVSHDGGQSWEKFEGNPVIEAPPPNIDITGWRDPFLFRSATFENTFAEAQPNPTNPDPRAVYAMISGGERKGSKYAGGRLFLYRSVDFVHWSYVGLLFQAARKDKAGSGPALFGTNFEVSNVFSLPVSSNADGLGKKDLEPAQDLDRLFHLIVGSEGGRMEKGKEVHDSHWPLWVSGRIVPDPEHGVRFQAISSGVGDWGAYYAANSFEDPKTNRRIVFGWSNDENEAIRKSQGWGGILTLPREHLVVNYHRVANFKKLLYPKSFTVISTNVYSGHKVDTIRTLGVRPVREIKRLRQRPFPISPVQGNLGSAQKWENTRYQGKHYEIHAQFQFPTYSKNGKFGFIVRASPDFEEHTSIYFDMGARKIVVDKSKSSSNRSIDCRSEWGVFELLDIQNPVGIIEKETLDIRIFVDNSIIEVIIHCLNP